MAILSYRNLTISFSGPTLLDNQNLSIDQGEKVCLVGRNGEGKSTLLRLLANQIYPDSGEIEKLPDLRIAMLFVGKIIIYSWVGAVLGCILGYVLALELNMAGVPVKCPWDLITGLVIGTPLATILFGLGPVLTALMQETNDLMREKAG